MAIQYINIGSLANDGSGDPLRTAFAKVNNNFAELYNAATLTTAAVTAGGTGNQIVFQTDANTFTGGTFQINSQQILGNANANVISYGNNSQNVTLVVARLANSNNVSHTAFSTIFHGNIIVNDYNVEIANVGNVAKLQISVSPDTANLGNNTNMIHTVSYRLS